MILKIIKDFFNKLQCNIIMQDLLEFGEITFYEGIREKNKRKAVKFVNKIRKNGFIEYNLYFNDYGYIIKNL